MSLKRLIDKPDKLLELINSLLKPKDIEKQKFGEVFTPMHLIDKMLNKLDTDYKSHHNNKSIFSNSDLKWLDPASGIGNFPIAEYLRLIDNLTSIVDKEERKKHILKNIYLCKQIFDIDNIYKLNIHQGDTLTLDIKKTFKVDKFDIIMGNPPYNSGGIKSSSGNKLGDKNITIWPKFVELSVEHLKDNGYMLFINPLSWLKTSHSVHDLLLSKHIIWLELWDDIYAKQEIHGCIPISLYLLKNIKNSSKKETEIVSKLKKKNLEIGCTIYLDKRYSIPLAYHTIFSKIIKKIEKYSNLELVVENKTCKSNDKKAIKIPDNFTSKNNY